MKKQPVQNATTFFKKVMLVFSALLISNMIHAAVVTRVWNGSISSDWSNANNWTPSGVPNTSSEDVVIPSGTTYAPTLNTTLVCKDFTLSSGVTLTISGSSTLKIYGTIGTINGSISGTGAIDINATGRNGVLSLTGTGTVNTALTISDEVQITTGSSLTFANLNIANSQGVTNDGIITILSGKTLTNDGKFTNNGTFNGEFTSLSSTLLGTGEFIGTVTIAGTTSVTSGSNLTFDNLTVSAGFTNNATITVQSNLSISSGSIFTNNSNVAIYGDLSGAGTFKNNNVASNVDAYSNVSSVLNVGTKGNFTYYGGAQTINTTYEYYNLFLANGIKTLNENVTVNGDLTINSSASLTGTSTITLSGNANNFSSFVCSPTVSFVLSSSSAKTIQGKFSNVTVSSSSNTDRTLQTTAETQLVNLSMAKNTILSNSNVIIIENTPTFSSASTAAKYTGTGIIIVGTGISYSGTPQNAQTKFEINGSLSSFISSATNKFWEYGSGTNKQEIVGVNFGSSGAKTFTPASTPLSRVANNARVMAGRSFSHGSTPVPVSYVSFSGKAVENTVLLEWKTSQENNNKEFAIEASVDGQNFEAIGVVEGAGNSNNLKSYTFASTNHDANTIFYRIKQIDFDGNHEYSKVIVVNVGNVETANFSVFPNPLINQELFLNFTGLTDETIEVKIYDVNETVHFAKTLTLNGAGIENLTSIDASKLSKGVYFVSIQTQSGVKTQKLIVE